MRRPILAILTLALLAPDGWATIINVPDDYPTIQAGIDAANSGDVVLIAPGTYTEDVDWGGTWTMLNMKDGVTLRGDGEVILDVDWEGGAIYGGPGAGTQAHYAFENLTICCCIGFEFGGGIQLKGASATLDDIRFESTHAEFAGGGLYCRDSDTVTVTNCRFEDTYTESGGGIAFVNSGLLEIDNCTFEDSFADGGQGGDIFASGSDTVNIVDCLFVNGFSDIGGWMSIVDTDLTATGSTFYNDEPYAGYGGIHLGAIPTRATHTISRSILVGAVGNAVVCESPGDLTVQDCCDVFGNGGDYVGCLVGWDGVNGNFSADPMFCNMPAGRFLLHELSPCAPAGNSCGLQVGAFGVGCGMTGVEESSISAVKSLY